jgi:hypothetical protein
VGFENSFNEFLFSVVSFLMFIIFAIIVMVFVTSFVKGLGLYFRNNSTPEETIPARLVAKRIHTWGGYNGMNSRASYYAIFETEKGERMKFPVSSNFSGMYAEGDTGMLTHKGTRFIGFERERFHG